MTDNPFDALEGGGFDMGALLQQAQQMQEQLQSAQAQLAEVTVEGTSGGGAVAVTLTGIGDLVAVTIRPGTFNGDDADDLTDLSDLVVAAFRDAKSRADELATQTLGPLAGGGLPGLG